MHSVSQRRQSGSFPACRRAMLVLPSLFVLCIAGCSNASKMYPVTGKVQWKGGGAATELVDYTVSLESADRTSSAVAVVQPDGSFTVSTQAENDGAAPGKYRVTISPPAPELDKPAPRPVLSSRYSSAETSGLEIEVKPEPNNVTLEVERSQR